MDERVIPESTSLVVDKDDGDASTITTHTANSKARERRRQQKRFASGGGPPPSASAIRDIELDLGNDDNDSDDDDSDDDMVVGAFRVGGPTTMDEDIENDSTSLFVESTGGGSGSGGADPQQQPLNDQQRKDLQELEHLRRHIVHAERVDSVVVVSASSQPEESSKNDTIITVEAQKVPSEPQHPQRSGGSNCRYVLIGIGSLLLVAIVIGIVAFITSSSSSSSKQQGVDPSPSSPSSSSLDLDKTPTTSPVVTMNTIVDVPTSSPTTQLIPVELKLTLFPWYPEDIMVNEDEVTVFESITKDHIQKSIVQQEELTTLESGLTVQLTIEQQEIVYNNHSQ